MPSIPQPSPAWQKFEYDYPAKVLLLTRGTAAEAALLAQRNRTDFSKLLKRHNNNPEKFKNK